MSVVRKFSEGDFVVTAEAPHDDLDFHRDGTIIWAIKWPSWKQGGLNWRETIIFHNLLTQAVDYVRQAEIAHNCRARPLDGS